jgi:hypothetical protein
MTNEGPNKRMKANYFLNLKAIKEENFKESAWLLNFLTWKKYGK